MRGPKTFEDIQSANCDGPDIMWSEPTELLGQGYGADAYTLTDADIERLRTGDIMMLSAQGEYVVYVRVVRI